MTRAADNVEFVDQDAVNSQEWQRPENWHGGFFGFYKSQLDSRLWVPKRTPWMGYTLNYAREGARLTLIGLLAVPFVLVVVLWLIVSATR